MCTRKIPPSSEVNKTSRIPQSCWRSASLAFERGTKRQSNGAGWLWTRNKTQSTISIATCLHYEREQTHLIAARLNATIGSTGFPSLFKGFSISYTVSMVAIAIQTVSMAMAFPEHDLYRDDNDVKCEKGTRSVTRAQW